MAYVKDIHKDEIREGFLVTSHRKRAWEAELAILDFFDGFCARHGLQYYAEVGTLLGAARHGGYVPWDDDIDVSLMRPDYEKFQNMIKDELPEYYFLQNSYSDRLIPISKIRDSRTSAIEFHDKEDLNQGIFIDVYPLDVTFDGSDFGEKLFIMQKELWMAVMAPDDVRKGLAGGLESEVGADSLLSMTELSPAQRMAIYEAFQLENFGRTESVTFFPLTLSARHFARKLSWYDEVVTLPFEGMKIPAPKDYEDVLLAHFGKNWKNPMRGGSQHEKMITSVDIPYREYMEKINPKFMKRGI